MFISNLKINNMVYKVYTFLHTKFLNYHNSAPWWLLRIYTHAHAQSAPSGHCHYIVYSQLYIPTV